MGPNRSVSLSFSFIFLDAGCHASLDASCGFHAKARHKEKQWKAQNLNSSFSIERKNK